MTTFTSPVQDDQGAAAQPRASSAEKFRLRGDALAAKVKELLHEGSVRRITVKNSEGQSVIEIPVTAGVVAAVAAPVLVAVAALAAVASDWEIEVHHLDEPSAG